MAGVTLTQLFLHDAADLSDYIAIDLHDLPSTKEAAAEARTYANGRIRLVTTPAAKQSIAITCRNVSPANRAILEGWTGTFLMLREPWGRVRWGFYASLDDSQWKHKDVVDVSFTFQSITASAAV